MKTKVIIFAFLAASECLFADNYVFLHRDDGHEGFSSSSVIEVPEVSYGEQRLKIKTKDTRPYTIIIKDANGRLIYSKFVAPTDTTMEIFLPANVDANKCHIELCYSEALLKGTFAQ